MSPKLSQPLSPQEVSALGRFRSIKSQPRCKKNPFTLKLLSIFTEKNKKESQIFDDDDTE